jgi:hypothetical protein
MARKLPPWLQAQQRAAREDAKRAASKQGSIFADMVRAKREALAAEKQASVHGARQTDACAPRPHNP